MMLLSRCCGAPATVAAAPHPGQRAAGRSAGAEESEEAIKHEKPGPRVHGDRAVERRFGYDPLASAAICLSSSRWSSTSS